MADAEGIEAVSMRRVARELGLGTMSLYHYVKSKDELLDLMGDGIMQGQLVDDDELTHGWRAGLSAIAQATRGNFERHPWLSDAMRPRPNTIPGPSALRHVDQSLAAVADLDVDVRTRMKVIGLVDDYVIGFVTRAERAMEATSREAEAEWIEAVFGHLRDEVESGAYPHLQAALEAHRADGGTDEDLATMATSEDRFEMGLEVLLDGVEVMLRRER